MILVAPQQRQQLREWFLPEQPGPLIGSHVINTGNGACFVDRWPDPGVVLAHAASNYTLLGDAQSLRPYELRPHTTGFVNTLEGLVPFLMRAFPDAQPWPRIILTQKSDPEPRPSKTFAVRRLTKTDAYHLWGLSPEIAWISKTWGGPSGLAQSGYAWGAFVDDRLTSVACTFFLGHTYEEIGVVTEPEFQRRGLSTACAHALCDDVRARGHLLSWTTSHDNTASLRVAQKLGFVEYRRDTLYAVGVRIPESE